MATRQANVVAVIPVRERDVSSDGQLRMLAGRPLLAYTIEAARVASTLHRVIVSTDGSAVMSLARTLGAEVPFLRPRELAAPDVGLGRVLQHCVEWMEQEDHYSVGVVVLLEVSHPLRPPGLIDRVVQTMLASGLDSVFTAYEDRHTFWSMDEHGELSSVLGSHSATRADRKPLYRELTGLVCASRAEVVRNGQVLGTRVGVVPVRELWGLVDTQDETSLQLAELLLAKNT